MYHRTWNLLRMLVPKQQEALFRSEIIGNFAVCHLIKGVFTMLWTTHVIIMWFDKITLSNYFTFKASFLNPRVWFSYTAIYNKLVWSPTELPVCLSNRTNLLVIQAEWTKTIWPYYAFKWKDNAIPLTYTMIFLNSLLYHYSFFPSTPQC